MFVISENCLIEFQILFTKYKINRYNINSFTRKSLLDFFQKMQKSSSKDT